MGYLANVRGLALGFTGTRYGMTLYQGETLRQRMADLRSRFEVFMHGDCRGADEQAHYIALDLGYHVVKFPPEDDRQRAYCEGGASVAPAPYLKRNRSIVGASQGLIGCPHLPPQRSVLGGFVRNGGTWYTIDYAIGRNRANPAVLIIYPDGSQEAFGEPPPF